MSESIPWVRWKGHYVVVEGKPRENTPGCLRGNYTRICELDDGLTARQKGHYIKRILSVPRLESENADLRALLAQAEKERDAAIARVMKLEELGGIKCPCFDGKPDPCTTCGAKLDGGTCLAGNPYALEQKQRADDLQARLDKAVKALRWWEEPPFPIGSDAERIYRFSEIARAVLAELEGGEGK